jgi:hypothetical protein
MGGAKFGSLPAICRPSLCSPICQIDEYGGVANVFVAFRS